MQHLLPERTHPNHTAGRETVMAKTKYKEPQQSDHLGRRSGKWGQIIGIVYSSKSRYDGSKQDKLIGEGGSTTDTHYLKTIMRTLCI